MQFWVLNHTFNVAIFPKTGIRWKKIYYYNETFSKSVIRVNLLTSLLKNISFYIQHGTFIFLSYMNTYVALLLKITKPKEVYYSVSKFVFFEVSCWFVFWTLIWLIGMKFGFAWGVSLVLAEKMTKRANKIASLRGTRVVYQRHAKTLNEM